MITSLEILGYAGKAVSNRFFRQKSVPKTLAVLFPGLWYSCDMPLLFYPMKLLLQHGAEVLQIHTDYTIPTFQNSRPEEREPWLAADSRAALQTGLAQGNYTNLVLVGKSIGTLALASLLGSHFDQNALLIWLTPLLRQPALVKAASQYKGPALFIAGTGDGTYDPDALAQIQQTTAAEALLVEGADHSLEIPNDLNQSVAQLSQMIKTMDDFLQRHLK